MIWNNTENCSNPTKNRGNKNIKVHSEVENRPPNRNERYSIIFIVYDMSLQHLNIVAGAHDG